MNDLSDTDARPADREYTIAGGAGLSVVVRPNGTKLWLYRYRFGGKRKNMSFRHLPRRRSQGRARSATRPKSCTDSQDNEKARHTFRAVGREWLTTKLEKENKAKTTIKRETWNLGQLYREIGDKLLCETAAICGQKPLNVPPPGSTTLITKWECPRPILRSTAADRPDRS